MSGKKLHAKPSYNLCLSSSFEIFTPKMHYFISVQLNTIVLIKQLNLHNVLQYHNILTNNFPSYWTKGNIKCTNVIIFYYTKRLLRVKNNNDEKKSLRRPPPSPPLDQASVAL